MAIPFLVHVILPPVIECHVVSKVIADHRCLSVITDFVIYDIVEMVYFHCENNVNKIVTVVDMEMAMCVILVTVLLHDEDEDEEIQYVVTILQNLENNVMMEIMRIHDNEERS